MKIRSALSNEALLKILFCGLDLYHIANDAKMGHGVLYGWVYGRRYPPRGENDIRLQRLAKVLDIPIDKILRSRSEFF